DHALETAHSPAPKRLLSALCCSVRYPPAVFVPFVLATHFLVSCFPIHSVLFRPSERQHELTVATIKSRDLAGRLPIGHALFQVSALIARQFSLGNAELGFQPAVFPV